MTASKCTPTEGQERIDTKDDSAAFLEEIANGHIDGCEDNLYRARDAEPEEALRRVREARTELKVVESILVDLTAGK